MNPLRRLSEGYKRLRHGRGFGVHSPWAYNMIMNVLREDAAYYSYGAIDREFGSEAAVARAVFRIMVSERPAAVEVAGDRKWGRLRALACATGAGARMLIVEDAAAFKGLGKAEIVVFPTLHRSRNRELWEKLLDEREHGYALDTRESIGVLNLRKDLPRQRMDALVKIKRYQRNQSYQRNQRPVGE